MSRGLNEPIAGYSYRPSYDGQFPAREYHGRPLYKKESKSVAKRVTGEVYIVKHSGGYGHRTTDPAEAQKVASQFERTYGGKSKIIKKKTSGTVFS